LRLGLAREGVKKGFIYFLASPAKFGQQYVKNAPSEILNLWHFLHSPLPYVGAVVLGQNVIPGCQISY
jgi:hypothetical protein